MFRVTTAYSFFDVPSPAELGEGLRAAAREHAVRGLVIVAPEGFNGTFSCATDEGLEAFRRELRARAGDPALEFKDSRSAKDPFDRFTVKRRREIVSLGTPELRPPGKTGTHLTPGEWDRVLREEPGVTLIDLRNDYEHAVGTFPGALNPRTRKFSDFPAFLDEKNLPPDRKILMFCTGGIRCEKGILEMERRGFRNVFQLKGGILKYLEEKPDGAFRGECLVFDHRVAVDRDLRPSARYTWCPHCGNPAETKITCERCGAAAQVCAPCHEREFSRGMCSKNCRNIRARAKASSKIRSRGP